MNIKEALQILYHEDSKFSFRPEDLNKLFLIKLSTHGYDYVMHHNGTVNVMYLSVSESGSEDSIYFSFKDSGTFIYVGNEQIKVPDFNASTDEWFNFNIQHSNITKDDLYPELNNIVGLLREEYNRVLLETLEYRRL